VLNPKFAQDSRKTLELKLVLLLLVKLFIQVFVNIGTLLDSRVTIPMRAVLFPGGALAPTVVPILPPVIGAEVRLIRAAPTSTSASAGPGSAAPSPPPPEMVSRLGRVPEQLVTQSCLEEDRSTRLRFGFSPIRVLGGFVNLASPSLISASVAEAISL
jgi:hypothetical protein